MSTDVQQKHKETLRAQTETLSVNTILMNEKVKDFLLLDRYAELTIISTVRDRTLVEHELLARGRDHEEWQEKHLRGELEKIRTDQLFHSSFSRSKSRSGSSASVAGVAGIGKTTMVQKIVHDWATGKIYPHFQFVFSFKFRDLNKIKDRINLRELILEQYPYFGNILGEIWKNPEGLLFIFDGLDEFKGRIDFADSRRDTEPQHQCADPESRCEVSDIVYSLIQHKLLPGCSVLVTTRPTALHLLEKAEISVRAEILGFVGEERKEYFTRYFEDQTVAAAVFKHVKENEILYTMSYNPSYCWILVQTLGPFFTQTHRDPQRVPKTITQLYCYFIYNILKNHGREIESLREVLLRVGQMAFTGVSKKNIVFTDEDLIEYNLQPSQFLSGFLMELLEREDSARSVVYTFPHLTIQEFVAALAQFMTVDPRNIVKRLSEVHSTTDRRFEVFLRFVAGLSSPRAARVLEEFLGPFPNETICRVIDWVKEEVQRQIRDARSEFGKRRLLNTLHYLFESQNPALAQQTLGSVETLSFSGLGLTPIDCAVLSHVIRPCGTIKHLDLWRCRIQCEGLQRLGPALHKCQRLGLGNNDLGDSGVKLVSAALRNPHCKIQRLGLNSVGLTDSGAEDLASALSTNPSLMELDLACNSLTDQSVPALCRLILNHPSLEQIRMGANQFSADGWNQLENQRGTRPGLRVDVTTSRDLTRTFSELLTQWNDHLLFQLTTFYGERLNQAIEERVERLSFTMKWEECFNEQEHGSVAELAVKGNRRDSSILFHSLVMEKGNRARRVMWESFVKMQNELPKLDKILKEIQELGPDPQEYMNITRSLTELPSNMEDVHQKHKETLQTQTETLSVNTILMNEKVKDFLLLDRYAELTIISTVRDRTLVEHELLARGRDHEEWQEKHLRGKLEKIRTDQLFHSSFSRSKSGSGSSASVAGVAGIGKTTMVQKIVHDWATGKIYPHFQFVFSFKFRDLNMIKHRITLKELILEQYPYFGNILGEVWKNPEGLLFIFDGLDEFKGRIDFADSRRDTEPKHQCPDPEWWCEVSDIVYSLIQHKLLPGCSVLVTTRPTALHLLEKAKISVWAEILGFVGEERKEYFTRYFEDQTVAAAVFKHVKENEILYTMSYNPSYCWILVLTLGPFFTQTHRDPQRVPKTITQLYCYFIYNILKNHGREIESLREVLLRVGQMAFTGVAEKNIVFTDGDLIEYNLQPSQFLSGFLMELLEREDSARSVVYTFPHLTIQEFVAALAQFMTVDRGDITTLLIEAHGMTDGRFEVFLRFVAGLSSPRTAWILEEFLGKFPHQTICRVIDWVKEEVKRWAGNTRSDAGKRSLLNTLHYLFESQNPLLAQQTLGSVGSLSFCFLGLNPIDCAVLSHAIRLCDTIKHLNLWHCRIQCEGLQRLGPALHKCQDLGLENNNLGDSGVKLVSAALRNPDCKIQSLWLNSVGLTDSGAEDLASALSTNHSLTELDLSGNELGDSGVKLVSAALRNPDCKIQTLRLHSVGLTDSGAEDLVSALSTNSSLTELGLSFNSLTDRCVPALRSLILNRPSLELIELMVNNFSKDGENQLTCLEGTRRGLCVAMRSATDVYHKRSARPATRP
ncbi:NACHT, LRR and PYD domains-containing protein 3-like isoform X2 [Leucoraja erinacea]|uniref:NACHT, LRR and PYD domains-containing protein 3-like isoform X2 n=1 Tax=Leucoraja erinaceus TaxID=7782 RepID=UPI002457D8B2|nr:NACHT, LRR and PYD domains-containing protein 3-like isoform X2 [Leucoraja erinacea]